MEDQVQGTDVNSNSSADSSSVEVKAEAATTPSVENTEAAKVENKIPQSRFNEVIEQRNADRARAEALEARLRVLESGRGNESVKDPVAEAEVRRMVSKLNMSEEAARELVDSQLRIAESQRMKLEAQQSKFRAEEWARQKAVSDKDYAAIEPELDKSFSSLTPQMQAIVASNPEALEMFYDSVKSRASGNRVKDAYNKGIDEANKNKDLKRAMSPAPSGSASNAKPALSPESIKKMTTKEYMERQSEINAWLAKGAASR